MGFVVTERDFDAAESLRRARMILDNAQREIEAARAALNENSKNPERSAAAGSLLAEYGAMFIDACNGVEPINKKGLTYKVRKALRYRYP